MRGFVHDLGDGPLPPAAAAPPQSDALGGYYLRHEIARGGQGVVYDAIQIDTQRRVAVKMIDPIRLAAGAASGKSDRAHRARQRLEREAAIAAGLRHPNIVTIYHSAALPDGRYALAMEFVDGVPIDAWTPPGLNAAERLRSLLIVFLGVSNAVHHAHLNGVIHRDLKPDNILVTAEGRPVVLDFGVAKTEGTHHTLTGEFAGTPAYASPEQVAGRSGGVDALTDVYSLGVILYRLLCKRMPYELEGSLLEVVRTITEVEPTPPRTVEPAIPADLQAIILRAMSKSKDRRYQSAAALARDIERFLAGEPVEARGSSGWYLLRKAVAINRGRLAAAGLAAILALAAGAVVVMSAERAAQADRREQLQRQLANAERVRATAVSELLREALPSPDPSRPELASIVGAGLGNLYYRLETGNFADQPEVDQALRRLWGSVYTGLGTVKAAGLVQFAEVSLRNGLVRLRMEHGLEHPEIAATMHELAGVLLVRSRFPEAEKMIADALAMRIKLLGAHSAAATESRALHARVLLAMDKPEEARAESQAALTELRKRPDADSDLAIAAMLTVNASIERRAGRIQAAEPLVREGLTRRLRRLPPEDPDLIASLSDAAAIAAMLPEGALADELGRAWGVPKQLAGEAVRSELPLITANTRNDPLKPSRSGRAVILQKLVRLTESLLGPDDPALVRFLIAKIRASATEWLPRSDAALQAADILGRRFGPSDPARIVCLEEAAVSLAYNGGQSQAADITREICILREQVPRGIRDELVIANSRRTLGWCLTIAGRYPEAITELETAIAAISEQVGPEHHLVALGQSSLALCLAETGRLDEALSMVTDAADLADRLPTVSPDQLTNVRVAQGHILIKAGRPAEALPKLESVWHDEFYVSQPTFRWRRMVLEDLAAACDMLGKADEAAAWRAQIIADQSRAPE